MRKKNTLCSDPQTLHFFYAHAILAPRWASRLMRGYIKTQCITLRVPPLDITTTVTRGFIQRSLAYASWLRPLRLSPPVQRTPCPALTSLQRPLAQQCQALYSALTACRPPAKSSAISTARQSRGLRALHPVLTAPLPSAPTCTTVPGSLLRAHGMPTSCKIQRCLHCTPVSNTPCSASSAHCTAAFSAPLHNSALHYTLQGKPAGGISTSRKTQHCLHCTPVPWTPCTPSSAHCTPAFSALLHKCQALYSALTAC
ncbi:hypothetical protein NDU88_000906 [Pleurodeles waltl]|uniref:Uncharacterized protein n=1 Tax=Pleurodeles waltl TaxID=8319 RepID=A0AAV7NCQ5_PLEWA|nr:hypothetical protein NDU88_000906 [Pleurodeles waltl]